MGDNEAGQLTPRVAVVTGAAGGLGSAVVRELAPRVGTVVAVDLDADRIRDAVGDLPNVDVLAADLGQWDACVGVIPEVIARHGQVDVLVSAAAILRRTEPADVTEAVFDHIFAVNARSVFALMRAAMADMESRGWGRIVNVTSIGVHTGGYSLTSAVYEATKAAIGNFTRTFARYGAPRGVLVNSVAPGGMLTPMLTVETSPEVLAEVEKDIPVGRLAEPREVAMVVAHLASPDNSYAAGATFDVNGGVVMP